MKELDIYTDGACSGNPGPGGWGVILIYIDKSGKKIELEISGSEIHTTNNRMEMLAVINALKQLKSKCKVRLYSDSKYVIDGITKWIYNWKSTNFKSGKVKNIDLWTILYDLSNMHIIEWIWVKGHSDNLMNVRADELARNAIVKSV